jgi:hypothetical protein
MPLRTPQQQRRATDDGNPGGRRWTFDRRVSLDTIVGVVGIAIVIGGPLILAWRAIDTRILTIEVKDEVRIKCDDKRDTEARDFRTQISAQLSDLSKQMTQTQITLGVLSGKLPGGDHK